MLEHKIKKNTKPLKMLVTCVWGYKAKFFPVS